MELLRSIEALGLKEGIPEFRPGDRVRVHVKVREGEKERIQVFEGDVIARRRDAQRMHPTRNRIIRSLNVRATHAPALAGNGANVFVGRV